LPDDTYAIILARHGNI